MLNLVLTETHQKNFSAEKQWLKGSIGVLNNE